MVDAIAGKDQRGIIYTQAPKPLDKLFDSIKGTDTAADVIIEKLKKDNKDLLQENFDTKDDLEKAEDMLEDLMSKYKELRHLSSKKVLAELGFIIKRKKESKLCVSRHQKK